MVRYRRNHVPGGTYFFTVTLRDRRSDWLIRHIDLLRVAIARTQSRHPFRIDAMAVLPEHLHMVMTLPDGDADYSLRWRQIKGSFTCGLQQQGLATRGVWQSRFWEHTVRDEDDLKRHVDYIHGNPVKHGHVGKPTDWPYSTIHHFIASGRIAANWGTDT
ncbi:REP-associated tyrosine transposase [Denitromonas iodatirespirans]|uniref:REP-associated tyrosine transposase n=1 Tax=Denitromonas iodatirespirans TaxID=2795389 RepID=UPI001E3807C7|nr:transposase [Denitromonas iodatirespirans]